MAEKRVILAGNIAWFMYNFYINLMRRLRQDGFEVFICCGEDEYASKLVSEGFKYISMAFDRKGANPFKDLVQFYSLYRLYKRLKPDIVLHFTIKPNIYGSWAARLAAVPFINTISGLGYIFLKNDLFCQAVRKVYRASCGLADKVFFQNEDDLIIFRKGSMFNESKVNLVRGSGVDTEYFKPASIGIFDVGKSKFTFLFSGRLLFDKGIREYIEAAKAIKEHQTKTEFQVLGPIDRGNPTGVNVEFINQWVKKGVITYIGYAEDVRPYLSGANCVVLPSYREGTPKSLLEAMAMGKPIITTDAAGCREIIEDGINGLLVKIKDVQSLTDAMIKMMSFTDEKREKMGMAGRRIVLEKFGDNVVIEKYRASINQLIKK